MDAKLRAHLKKEIDRKVRSKRKLNQRTTSIVVRRAGNRYASWERPGQTASQLKAELVAAVVPIYKDHGWIGSGSYKSIRMQYTATMRVPAHMVIKKYFGNHKIFMDAVAKAAERS